jgi:hypothetical protein
MAAGPSPRRIIRVPSVSGQTPSIKSIRSSEPVESRFLRMGSVWVPVRTLTSDDSGLSDACQCSMNWAGLPCHRGILAFQPNSPGAESADARSCSCFIAARCRRRQSSSQAGSPAPNHEVRNPPLKKTGERPARAWALAKMPSRTRQSANEAIMQRRRKFQRALSIPERQGGRGGVRSRRRREPRR